MSGSSYNQLRQSLRRLQGGKEQQSSIFMGILMFVVFTPLLFLTLCLPTIEIYKNILKFGFLVWINTISVEGIIMIGTSYAIGGAILGYMLFGFLNDIKIIHLLQDLEVFHHVWINKEGNIQNIDEILQGTKDIHARIRNLPALRTYAYTKDSRYLFLETTALHYFYEILIDLRKDLEYRISKEKNLLEQAQSEVERNIHGTTELNRISELQKARLDEQIQKFEELQRVLIKV